MTCKRCERPMVKKGEPRPSGARVHACRGLCVPCERAARHNGSILDYPRSTWTAADLFEDWQILTVTRGYNKRRCAEHLGVAYATLDRAIVRHRQRLRAKQNARPRDEDVRSVPPATVTPNRSPA